MYDILLENHFRIGQKYNIEPNKAHNKTIIPIEK